MAANMYRVGDYVYFENSSSNPYLVRRIEELNKTANGNVEAKVVCLFRRRDISSSLNSLADSNAQFEEESKQPSVSEQQRHQLKHRELFLSRQFESLPATHIRGKCSVTLLNETDVLSQYLDKEDCFFYSLVFDPVQKTLLADQGEIRVGCKYQAEIPDRLAEGESDNRNQQKMEMKVWDPDNPLTDRQIDQFLVVARAVGTFARALDCSSSIRQPSLHMSAAAASRDITLFHAMDTLQRNGYDLAKAMSTLVPQGGPVLCRDEMEEWSASEAMLFEEALEKYGKDFNDIRQDFLPWKSLASIVQFYYMWKTTDRYIQQKRLKAAEADSKLKQVYIPTYTKPNPNQIISVGSKPGMNGAGFQKGLTCESCHTTQSAQWYAWGPPNMQCRLCASCWIYWKKYGGLKTPTQLEGAARSVTVKSPENILPGAPLPGSHVSARSPEPLAIHDQRQPGQASGQEPADLPAADHQTDPYRAPHVPGYPATTPRRSAPICTHQCQRHQGRVLHSATQSSKDPPQDPSSGAASTGYHRQGTGCAGPPEAKNSPRHQNTHQQKSIDPEQRVGWHRGQTSIRECGRGRAPLLGQRAAHDFRNEVECSARHQASEAEPGRRPQPCRFCGNQGHQGTPQGPESPGDAPCCPPAQLATQGEVGAAPPACGGPAGARAPSPSCQHQRAHHPGRLSTVASLASPLGSL
ncbi:metastasis-associated protein MTA2 isoform X2 [Heteronotia binoei]|uniref:metastasis-associated protein MTA2 isoform X2 n=1 Tax=Heteronotia binoei TaxID=13085 RepID=UPI002931D41F|nr:metastasis-associated protein MTA2 isoform X2 [Heteronotia binoei]